MGGGAAQAVAPGRVLIGVSAAIDDQAQGGDRELKGQGIGVGVGRKVVGATPPGIHQGHRVAAGEPVIAGDRKAFGGLGRAAQKLIQARQTGRLADVSVVEQGQPAVAQAKKSEGGGHAPDGGVQPSRGRRREGAKIDQIAENLDVVGGRAFEVAAVGRHLVGHGLGECGQGGGAQAVVAGQAMTGHGQGLEVFDQVIAADVALDDANQVADLAVQGLVKAAPEVVVGAVENERRVAQPRIDAERQRIGMPSAAAGARMDVHPVIDEGAGAGSATGRVAQVGQPFEIVQGETPQERLVPGLPVHRPGAGMIAADEADVTVHDAPPVGRVARPRMGRNGHDGGGVVWRQAPAVIKGRGEPGRHQVAAETAPDLGRA